MKVILFYCGKTIHPSYPYNYPTEAIAKPSPTSNAAIALLNEWMYLTRHYDPACIRITVLQGEDAAPYFTQIARI